MPERPNYYAMLGILRSASVEEIRRAYLQAAQKFHPDKNERPGETQIFLDVQQAYEVLTDPKRRAEYDAALPKEQTDQHPINANILFSRQTLSPNVSPQLIYLLLDLSANMPETASTAPPLNICFALDCSTSMKGQNLDVVKTTAIQLLRKIRPQDVFSVVTFNDRAEVLIPATRGLDSQKAEVRIQMLQTKGGTEIYQGISAAVEEVKRYRSRECINHVILLTDGRTYGDEQPSLNVAKAAAELGIGISGLGIGGEWNDAFLDEIARLTGGSCYLVHKPKDIEILLREKFDRLAQSYADETILEIDPQEGVELSYAYRLQPEVGPLSMENKIRLGSILRTTPLNILLEFRVTEKGLKSSQVKVLHGRLHFSIASQKLPVPPIPLALSCAVSNQQNSETPPAQIVQALSRLTLYRMQEKARLSAAQGNYLTAAEGLQRLATHLLSQGEKELARTVLLEAQNLHQQKRISPEGEKQIKFGTRALLLPGKGK
jgi:Ca-activated chloride channel family protein